MVTVPASQLACGLLPMTTSLLLPLSVQEMQPSSPSLRSHMQLLLTSVSTSSFALASRELLYQAIHLLHTCDKNELRQFVSGDESRQGNVESHKGRVPNDHSIFVRERMLVWEVRTCWTKVS